MSKSGVIARGSAAFVLGVMLMNSYLPREYSGRDFSQADYAQLEPSSNLSGGALERLLEGNDSIIRDFNSGTEKKYGDFAFPDEISGILKHSKRIGVEPELLMAIRMAENGRDALAYGILPKGTLKERYLNDRGYNLDGEFFAYSSEKEKQLCWAAQTIKKNFERYGENSENQRDFIDYLADVWAPIGAKNDSQNLNKNWEKNVRFFYDRLKGN